MRKLGDFSHEEYRALLTRLAEGRVNLQFGNFAPASGHLTDGSPPPERFFLLRHDVDFSPARALSLAEQEASLGLKATYFLLLTSETYNLLNEQNRSLPRVLTAMGHEVGLHYDLPILEGDPDRTPQEALTGQAELLGALAGQAVRSIAMHNPSLRSGDPFRGSAEFVNAYDEAFTDRIAYFSDSCGAWRDATHETLTTGVIPPRLQLLIHPIWWAEAPGDRWSRLAAWAAGQDAQTRAIVEKTGDIWRRHKGVAQHDRRTNQCAER